MKLGICVAGVALFTNVACSQADESSAGEFSASEESNVSEVHVAEQALDEEVAFAVSRETIGINPGYLEQRLGVPRIKNDYQMVFEVQGCSVDYGIEGTTVVSVAVNVTGECEPMIDGSRVTTQTTFGDLGEDWADYVAECLASCGNAYDPSISLRFNGSRSNGFISVTYRADYQATAEAQSIWEGEIRRDLGLGPYEIPDNFEAMSCVQNPPSSVVRALNDVPVSSIYIFANVEETYC